MLEQICFSDAVLDSAREVFETMIFMDIQEDTGNTIDISENSLLGSITFRGSLEGCLAIVGAYKTCEKIAKGMMMMEPDDAISEEEVCDAVGELANMVMGAVKTRVQDTVKEMNVSIPTVVSGKQLMSNLGEGSHEVRVKTSVSGDAMEFILQYKEAQE